MNYTGFSVAKVDDEQRFCDGRKQQPICAIDAQARAFGIIMERNQAS